MPGTMTSAETTIQLQPTHQTDENIQRVAAFIQLLDNIYRRRRKEVENEETK